MYWKPSWLGENTYCSTENILISADTVTPSLRLYLKRASAAVNVSWLRSDCYSFTAALSCVIDTDSKRTRESAEVNVSWLRSDSYSFTAALSCVIDTDSKRTRVCRSQRVIHGFGQTVLTASALRSLPLSTCHSRSDSYSFTAALSCVIGTDSKRTRESAKVNVMASVRQLLLHCGSILSGTDSKRTRESAEVNVSWLRSDSYSFTAALSCVIGTDSKRTRESAAINVSWLRSDSDSFTAALSCVIGTDSKRTRESAAINVS
ncbi:hypothetical protein J6590_060239 [Homalodisca vitripennis]|nr:hypothetical protein J6590_060239 [Homalodisca vitripennis]